MARGIETGNSGEFWQQKGLREEFQVTPAGEAQVHIEYAWESGDGASIVVDPHGGSIIVRHPLDHMFLSAPFSDVSSAVKYLTSETVQIPMPGNFPQVGYGVDVFSAMREFLPPDRVDGIIRNAWSDVSDLDLATRDALWYEQS